ncbi:MAG TPA: hypothetical protein VF939_20995 [Puia sp.]
MPQHLPFNPRLQQLKESDPTGNIPTSPGADYETYGPPKKLWLLWESGRICFFYYHYLHDADLDDSEDINVFTLEFMAKRVVLKGYNLRALVKRFEGNEPPSISIINPRYVGIATEDDYFVIDVTIEK